jgi:signal transduction histidine kinase
MGEMPGAGAMDRPPPMPESNRPGSPSLIPLLTGSLVSLLFAILLAQYFARPIRSLGHAFESVAQGRLGTRIGGEMGHRHDELADLGRGFDNMADHLQRLVEGKQRLLHDVSHELRSPLARLQAAIDLMQQQPDRADEFITRIERESTRIDRLVEELLTLARLDAGIPGIQLLEVDLNEVVLAISDDAAFEAETKKCRVKTSLPDKACVHGNPDLLHRAIENVVRNAIRYTPEGGNIAISIATDRENNHLYLEVKDEGDGVPENQLKLIFEPFYRSPNADRFTGFGIGMAITKRIVEAHDGTVTASNRKEGGLSVVIKFPLMTNSAAC